MHLSVNNTNWIFWKLHSWNMHEQRNRMGKCLRAAHSNLFCIWGFNTTPLCSPTEALHRKTVNKTPQCRSLCASSPTCSCHGRRTGRWVELLTHLAHDKKTDMTGRTGGDGEGGKSLGRWECICNKAALGFHFIVLGGFWRQMCRLHSGDRLPLCISFIIHIRIPPYHHPIIFFQLALSPLPFGLSLIRVCRVSHARDTHRI